MKTLLERFTDKYIPVTESGCWLWIGATFKGGYGQIKHGDKRISAHRVSWELSNGEVPDGLQVCHHCDVTCCVNPGHLFVGTNSDNQRDAYSKGRQKRFHDRKLAAPYQRYIPTGHIRLTERDVLEIISSDGTVKSIAEKYHVSPTHVGELRSGKSRSWRHLMR